MSQTSVDFLNLFVRPPGDVVFFLAVIAVTQAGLFMALGQRLRRPEDHASQRYTLATIGAMLTWVLLMIGALFALLSQQNATVVLPPLERVAQIIIMLLLGWAFISEEQPAGQRLSNIILLLLLAATIAGYILTGTQWAYGTPRMDFNLSSYGLAWSFLSTLLAAAGVGVMVARFRMIVDAPLKVVFFAILLLGYGGTLLQTVQGNLIGDYAGPARLAFLGALLIMPVVIYRMVITSLQAVIPPPIAKLKTTTMERAVVPPQSYSPLPASPVERESVQLLRALGLILENASPESIPQRIITASLDMLKADVGVLLKLQDANYADIMSAYDRVMGRPLSGMALNLDNQPTLVNAIERLAQRPLYLDRNVEELQEFYTRLDINQAGPVYFQPLVHDGTLTAVLAICLPYSGRELTSAEEELLKGIGVISAGLVSLAFAANTARILAEERAIQAIVQGVSPDVLPDDNVISMRQEMQASLELARDQIGQLSRQVMELKIQLDDERSRVASMLGDSEEALSISQRILALNEEQRALREERDRLSARLQEAEAALAGATSGFDNKDVVERLISGLEREKKELTMQHQNLKAQVEDLRAQDKVVVQQEVQNMLNRMMQEKARLEMERDQLSSELSEIQEQLKSVGIEDASVGLAQLISQLYEQRAALQTKSESLKAERDTLLNERTRLEDVIKREKERETRIQTLQNELLQLAADREAAVKQRDRFRVERDDLIAKQNVIKQHRARLLAQSAGYEMELNEAHQEQIKLRQQILELADERSALTDQINRLLAEKQALETDRDQLMARVEGDRDRLQQLGADGVGSLTKMVEELSAQRSQLERELNQARTSLASLQDKLEMLQVKMDVEQPKDMQVKYQPDNPDLIMGLVQELRTPMTSISGYVDLLLGESPGILGEAQRKFLQRVSANVARLAIMLDDLIQITQLDTGKFTLEPAPVDVGYLIEDAITNASTQFREKGLEVRMNVPADLPTVQGDSDAITQIIGQLLTNAYLVSAPESEVSIIARRQSLNLTHNGKTRLAECVVVSVEDRGGGIAPEDEARVFARKYKAENPLIAGLGDTGVGLSIAKALVEAHHGHLWLETRENLGTIFTFALPLEPIAEIEE